MLLNDKRSIIMKMKLAGVLLIAGIAVSAVTFAQTTPTPAEVHKWDKKRVKEGIKSGEITKAEAKTLRAENKNLKTDVKAAKADGTVTGAEKKKVAKDQVRLSRSIYIKKHNSRKRA
jgi:uncharacterized membrane protein YebE (DUF533 family)